MICSIQIVSGLDLILSKMVHSFPRLQNCSYIIRILKPIFYITFERIISAKIICVKLFIFTKHLFLIFFLSVKKETMCKKT